MNGWLVTLILIAVVVLISFATAWLWGVSVWPILIAYAVVAAGAALAGRAAR